MDPTDAQRPRHRDLEPVWLPTASYLEGSHLQRLMVAMGIVLEVGRAEDAYAELYWRSIDDPETFWRLTLEALAVEWFTPFTRVVDLSNGIQWPRWFPGGKLNLAHNALFRHLRERAEQTAIIWEGEDGAVASLSYAELAREVAKAANALRKLGIGRGDRIGLFLPMLPETAIAALAIGQVGAKL